MEELVAASDVEDIVRVPIICHSVHYPGPVPGAEEDLGGRKGEVLAWQHHQDWPEPLPCSLDRDVSTAVGTTGATHTVRG